MKGRYYCEEHMSPTYQDIMAEKSRFEKKEIKGNKRGKRTNNGKVILGIHHPSNARD